MMKDFDLLRSLPQTLMQLARYYWRKLHVRVALMGLLAFVALGSTQLVEVMVPDRLAQTVPGAAADRLLNVIANAMLAVTTFSLTVMVSVYQSSSSQWTPRVHQLIMQDSVTQNTLAAFIGAYVFALVAIILRETGVYVDDRAIVLFWVTVLVLAYVVWSLIRWVLHLQTLGSLIHTTRQVEEITCTQFRERLDTPCLGAQAWDGTVPGTATPIRARQSGYVQHIYPEALQELAEKADVTLFLSSAIGSFVFLNEPLVWVEGPVDDRDAFEDEVRSLTVMGDVRTYDQDPRFGLLIMSEIGSKALSPGVNDPGTAIDVLNRCARILSLYKDETEGEAAPLYDRLRVQPIDPVDLITDAYSGIARDGAGDVEVQQRLQRCLNGLLQHPDKGLQKAAETLGREYLNRALEAITWAPDRDRLLAKTAPRLRD
ncbi:DUF2254 domain-containing protein [uncultured Tateyamaria sp.]|uniref:DUF2254 domain-containing protein n=1 Tax=uncultured Tateyamaria sp. TaxID=455651 RepID=UPI00260C5768|nr:DUF2254 domain-containing protein [uncultured Tateyamaria sp.]